jgi:hypothetical protein
VQQLVELFLGGADRDKLDPILDSCVAVYTSTLDEDPLLSGYKWNRFSCLELSSNSSWESDS